MPLSGSQNDVQVATITALDTLTPLDTAVHECAWALRSAAMAAKAASSLLHEGEPGLSGARGVRCEKLLTIGRERLERLGSLLEAAVNKWNHATSVAELAALGPGAGERESDTDAGDCVGNAVPHEQLARVRRSESDSASDSAIGAHPSERRRRQRQRAIEGGTGPQQRQRRGSGDHGLPGGGEKWALPAMWWSQRVKPTQAAIEQLSEHAQSVERAIAIDGDNDVPEIHDHLGNNGAYVQIVAAAAEQGSLLETKWGVVRSDIAEWSDIARVVASGELGESGSMLPFG